MASTSVPKTERLRTARPLTLKEATDRYRHELLDDEERLEIITTRDDELRRKDTIIMQMAQRIPELEAPAETRESPEPQSGPTPTATSEVSGGPRASLLAV